MCFTQLYMWATIWSELESASLAGEDSDDWDWRSLDAKSVDEMMSTDARMSWWSDTNPESMTRTSRILECWSVMMRSSRWSGSFRVGDLACCSKSSVSSTSSNPGLIERSRLQLVRRDRRIWEDGMVDMTPWNSSWSVESDRSGGRWMFTTVMQGQHDVIRSCTWNSYDEGTRLLSWTGWTLFWCMEASPPPPRWLAVGERNSV